MNKVLASTSITKNRKYFRHVNSKLQRNQTVAEIFNVQLSQQLIRLINENDMQDYISEFNLLQSSGPYSGHTFEIQLVKTAFGTSELNKMLHDDENEFYELRKRWRKFIKEIYELLKSKYDITIAGKNLCYVKSKYRL